jgi:hypothetical protein
MVDDKLMIAYIPFSRLRCKTNVCDKSFLQHKLFFHSTLQAISANTFDANLYPLNLSRKGFLQVFHVDTQAFRAETVNGRTPGADEMRVWGVVFIGGHAVMCRPAADGYPLKEILLNEEFENPVDRHLVDRLGSAYGMKYFRRSQRAVIPADHFHDMQSIGSGFQTGIFQQLCVVALFTHG